MNFMELKSPDEMLLVGDTERSVSDEDFNVDDIVTTTSPMSSPSSGRKGNDNGSIALETNDVLSGRSQLAHNHPGNRQFRSLVAAAVAGYTAASSNLQKGNIVTAIIDKVQAAGGRFLKQDGHSGSWIELGDQEAKSKVAHAIRDKTANFEARTRRMSGVVRKALNGPSPAANNHKDKQMMQKPSPCAVVSCGKSAPMFQMEMGDMTESSLFFLKQLVKAPSNCSNHSQQQQRPASQNSTGSLSFPQIYGGDDFLDAAVASFNVDNSWESKTTEQQHYREPTADIHGGSFLDGFLGITIDKYGKDSKLFQLSSPPVSPQKSQNPNHGQFLKDLRMNSSRIGEGHPLALPSHGAAGHATMGQEEQVDDDFSDADFLDCIDEVLN